MWHSSKSARGVLGVAALTAFVFAAPARVQAPKDGVIHVIDTVLLPK